MRRQRQAETAALLGAIERLEAQLAAQPGRADLSNELTSLVESVRSARLQIDAVQLTAAVAQLAATLDSVQQRLSALVANEPTEATPEPTLVQPPFALALTAVAAQAIAAADSGPEQEPIKVLKAGTIPPPPPFSGEDFTVAEELPAADQAAEPQVVCAIPPSATGEDPLQQIMALSEEERLALFS